jgi:AhpC/TSA family
MTMIYIVAAVVLVGVLATLNLMFTLAVIRRLREHTQQLAGLASGEGLPADAMKAVGEQVGEFAAVAIDGATVSRDSLADPTVFGFFTPSCSPCRENAPGFAEHVERMPGGPDRALAVVVGGEQEAAEFAATYLKGVVRVVVEADSVELGPMVNAFEVRAFPSFFLLDGQGVVTATANSAANLPVPAAV